MTTATKENKKSFCKRVRTFAAPSELITTKICYMLAKHAHRAQKRKEKDENGESVRYFEHSRRVALILMDELNIRDPKLVQTALLHDTIEDCEDIDSVLIEQVFGIDVAKAVIALTKTKANKETYYSNLLSASSFNLGIAIVKGADRLDNLRSLRLCDKEFIAKQIKETNTVVLPTLKAAAATASDTIRFQALNRVIHKIQEELQKLQEENPVSIPA